MFTFLVLSPRNTFSLKGPALAASNTVTLPPYFHIAIPLITVGLCSDDYPTNTALLPPPSIPLPALFFSEKHLCVNLVYMFVCLLPVSPH